MCAALLYRLPGSAQLSRSVSTQLNVYAPRNRKQPSRYRLHLDLTSRIAGRIVEPLIVSTDTALNGTHD